MIWKSLQSSKYCVIILQVAMNNSITMIFSPWRHRLRHFILNSLLVLFGIASHSKKIQRSTSLTKRLRFNYHYRSNI